MSSKSSTVLMLATLAGAVAGLALGYFLPGLMLSLSFIGQLFINALQIVVIPIIVAGVVVGVAAMADIGRVNRTAGKTLLYFAATGAIAVVVGLILAFAIQPGSGLDTTGAGAPSELTRVTSFSLTSVLGSILPESLTGALASGQYLWLVLFALIFGGVLISIGSAGKPIIDFFEGVNEVMARIVQALLYAAPLGVLSLVATAIAGSVGSVENLFGSLGMFSLTVIAGLVIQGAVILVLALRLLGDKPVLEYLSATAPALTTAFGTGSPVATLPVTLDRVINEGDVDSRAGAITLPLGAVLNMNGTAVYLTIGAIFCAQAFGVELSILQVVLLAVAAFFLSIGASLIPNASLLILGVLLYSADFPVAAYAGIGIIVAVDWLFDRLRTVVNVWGDAVGAAVIGETFDFKTARRVGPPDRSSRRQKPKRERGSKGRDSSRPPRTRDKKDRGDRRRGDSRDDRQPKDRPDRRKRPQKRDRKPQRSTRSDRDRSRPQEKKENNRQSTPYELPPAPFHVLETELKARKKPEPEKESKPSPAEKSSPTDELVERERAKIAAQLDELKQREKTEETPTQPPKAKPADQQQDRSAEERNSKPAESAYPKIDFSSDDDLAAPPPDSEPEKGETPQETELEKQPENREETPEKEDSSQEQPVAYGRGRSRKGPYPKDGNSDEKTDETPVESPEYKTENISFGRGKRKKPSS